MGTRLRGVGDEYYSSNLPVLLAGVSCVIGDVDLDLLFGNPCFVRVGLECSIITN